MSDNNGAKTGTMQFGGDQPGVFLHGTHALEAADYLEMVLEDRLDEAGQNLIGQLIYTFRGCHVRTPGHKDGLTTLKDFSECVVDNHQEKGNGENQTD